MVHFQDLPDDVIFAILAFLSPQDILSIQQVRATAFCHRSRANFATRRHVVACTPSEASITFGMVFLLICLWTSCRPQTPRHIQHTF